MRHALRAIALAALLAAIPGAALALPVPALAAPARLRPHIYNEAVPGPCLALTAGTRGKPVTDSLCGGQQAQRWAIAKPRIMTPAGLCLTATWDSRVITARCGWPLGQRWTWVYGGHHDWQIGSGRYPGWCLALPPSGVGPVQLDPCGGPSVAQGGTGYWTYF